MYSWVPVISDWFPGSGITPFTVWDLSVDWWLVFKTRAQAAVEAAQSRAREGRRGK